MFGLLICVSFCGLVFGAGVALLQVAYCVCWLIVLFMILGILDEFVVWLWFGGLRGGI